CVSNRRRHTRSARDWSSDVCSSDLHQLRQKDVFNIADVEVAVLEPSGAMSVLPKKDYIPPTAKDLGLQLAPHKDPQTVIMDGKVLLEPLANLSLNPTWLETELEKLNVSKIGRTHV